MATIKDAIQEYRLHDLQDLCKTTMVRFKETSCVVDPCLQGTLNFTHHSATLVYTIYASYSLRLHRQKKDLTIFFVYNRFTSFDKCRFNQSSRGYRIASAAQGKYMLSLQRSKLMSKRLFRIDSL